MLSENLALWCKESPLAVQYVGSAVSRVLVAMRWPKHSTSTHKRIRKDALEQVDSSSHDITTWLIERAMRLARGPTVPPPQNVCEVDDLVTSAMGWAAMIGSHSLTGCPGHGSIL